MNFTHIFALEETSFGKVIHAWADSISVETSPIDLKDEEKLNEIEGLLLFHENQDFDRSQQELMHFFEQKQKAISKIDINGTLSVAVSNFSLWMDRNKCKTLLATGSEDLTRNPNLDRFLEQLKQA
jgi:hypothetical protein